MKTILKPIALNEKSYNVTLLHKALEALGLLVAKTEVTEGKAGEDTFKKVRALQTQLNVPVDNSVLVDEATTLAIARALEERGLVSASRSFTVTGTVRLSNGTVKKRQRLLAFDLDLRGVAVYRTVKSIAEITKNGGFEFLGEAVSDNLGNYSITFYDWQYGQAERKKADVVVYALEGEEIIGRSLMVNSEDYSEKGLVRDLDVFIELEDKRTEYEALMSALNAFLQESKTSLDEIATSRDQLVFTAGELDVDQSRINIVASAELLAKEEKKQLSHELLYGIGRQNIRLSWPALYKKQEEELRRAIAKSVDERIIHKVNENKVAEFLHVVQECAVKHMLDDKDTDNKNTLNAMLKNALPEEKQRLSFVNALGNFTGSDFRKFWDEHLCSQPEFKDKPELKLGLLFTQQLTLLTGNHQVLVNELQVNRKLTSVHQLFELKKKDWTDILEKTGVPDFIEGKDDEEKRDRYFELMQGLLNAAFPTRRIAKMVEENELPIEKTKVSTSISKFLSENEQFDFASSRIHDCKKGIEAAAGEEYKDEVRVELMKIQRVFQVSTSPEAMKVLLENNLHSAYTIANIPRKSFIKTYGNALGGEHVAFAIHQRASHISTRAEMVAMHLLEYSHGLLPRSVMAKNEYKRAMKVINEHMPNPVPSYVELFGSPDICECEHCRSVYSAAAYFVELMRFLASSPSDPSNPVTYNDPETGAKKNITPLDILVGNGKAEIDGRRPDLLNLKLTCENTNTIIPYVDLANEVMEYYVVKGSLTDFPGYDTGKATDEELRANPQHFNLDAYSKLKDAKYPFTLPYHQPLDVIRTYSDHLKVSRYEAMKAMNPEPDAAATKSIQAESLGISQEEYRILTGETFDGTVDTTSLHEYFGYDESGKLENMSAVREFLQRSGIAYIDLVELVKTQFINPYQGTLDFLKKIFSCAFINADIYAQLGKIEAGELGRPAADSAIWAALNRYPKMNISPGEFTQWVTDHLGEFRQVITLYEPESKCSLETTKLRTIQSIYDKSKTSGITNGTWSKFHRFIRLWRKLGWTIHETDLMLAALGKSEITPETISKLEAVSLLRTATKLPLNHLAVLWGNIDTYGDKSLYKKLFLNKAVQQIDEAFEADAWGNYLQDNKEILAAHQSAILAAFRITEEDLDAILEVAEVIYTDEHGDPKNRNLELDQDILNIQNLSTIYRYVVLAKALKLRITDLCKLIGLFGASPFSTWDIQHGQFTSISPKDTYEFYKLAASTKKAGFKSPVLEYILQGTLPADSTLGLDNDKTLLTAKAIRDAFAAIEQDHQETPEAPLTTEILTAKLSLTFQPKIVSRFMGILEGSASFETSTDANLNVIIPNEDSKDKKDELVATHVFASQDEAAAFLREFSRKYAYVNDVNGSGRLTCTGVMSDTERTVLKGLANVTTNFKKAVDELYAAPETFIRENFNGIFTNLNEANEVLLTRVPGDESEKELTEKLLYIYEHFLPLLKSKLRQDAITQHIAALIGLSEEATALLIAEGIDTLIKDLSTEGFSATYFKNPDWSIPIPPKLDKTIDFSWGNAAPHSSVPAGNFSVRWEAYIAAPASGEYTLLVEVEDADEVFELYLDDALILEKTTTDDDTSLEVVTELNAAQMYLLTLKYAETSQNAGVRMRWKTATTGLEIIPASVAYPAAILDDFTEKATVFHRAAKFISGFKISETELDHFLTYKGDFGNIDFKALTVDHWKRINDYMSLRNAVPQAQALLTDVFTLANTRDPAPTIDQLTEMLHLATGWDRANLDYLVKSYFKLSVPDDFKNEIAFSWLYEVMQIVSKTGISAETIATWGATKTDFKTLHDTAQRIKYTVKAKYEEEDWLELAGNLSDKIRENQKQALISYLLMQPAIQDAGVKDADGLFEYLLIDVQMGACMDTSRIVQANAAIQMFVNRCLLNLEKDVSPDAIDKDRWEWMKNYRVWEANRKVFLYPENWLEPEWRNDRSEFFKELESYLVQNDITERSVEQAFRKYLMSLNEVANLDVCGMHQENDDDGNLKYLHVFARTHNAPYKFFYRRWNKHRKWSAWEKVPLDIRCVEEGDDSGVHLIPVVWKNRLFLFWPEFMEVQKEREENDGMNVQDLATDKTVSQLKPTKSWEIRLAWSEYVDEKWSPKQVTKEYVEPPIFSVKNSLFRAYVDSTTQTLSIRVKNNLCFNYLALFKLSDIQSRVVALTMDKCVNQIVVDFGTGELEEVVDIGEHSNYEYAFSKREADSVLELMDDVYLQKPTLHRLLPVNTQEKLNITLDSPFFFSDDERTYFVRPVDIKVVNLMRTPRFYNPCIPKYNEPKKVIETIVPYPGPGVPLPAEFRGVNSRFMLAKSGSGAFGITASTAMMTRSGNAALEATSTRKTVAYIDRAFGVVQQAGPGKVKEDLFFIYPVEFHTFYHPFSSKFVTRLNQGGLPALMGSDTEDPSVEDAIKSDEGATFEDEDTYYPKFAHGLVQKPSDFDTRTYYKENVCFDVFGANSLYHWEFFFHAPLYIATRLSKNGKYKEAMKWFHYIFDPTTDEKPEVENETSRYWKVLPFKTTPPDDLEDWFKSLPPNTDPTTENAIIKEWRDKPFDPHLVASNRLLAYMKHVVIKYVENLIAWGDSLFRQFTRESVNEAHQLYVIANHILGPRPEFVPKRGEIKAESYYSLKDKWDDFSNALVQLENIFPYSSEVGVGSTSTGTNLLGIGSALYFCIPSNDKLLEYWDTAADRLFKIRHCQDIDGVERKLALFAPPISPEALIQAVSQGLSLGSILADLSSPPPIYRFPYLIQKANEFCSDVKALGSALLAALEKKDAEELSRLRASHETQMLALVTAIRVRQVLDAKVYKEQLLKARETAEFRFKHYMALLGNESVTVPPPPTIGATLTEDSQLPVDTSIPVIKTDVDESLVKSDERGVKLIAREKEELDKTKQAHGWQLGASALEGIAGIAHNFPQMSTDGKPLGVGAGALWGGQNIAFATSSSAKVAQIVSSQLSFEANKASKMASYIRREQDWTLQTNMAAKEIIQLDKQITSADIRIQVAEKELENHKQQIENAKEVELFLKDKFTNQELYQWMKEQLFAVYKQSYNLAYDMAKKAEKAYKYEMGTETTSFIQYGYWDNSKQGLVAGEKLQLALRLLEKSYLEKNRRELELTKSISLAMLNHLALIELRETGKCFVSLPEEFFDLDFQGHYFRRLKSVSLSIPCIAGPYTTVNCSLRLLKNTTRINTAQGDEVYKHNQEEGVWADDDRFRTINVPVTSIATSTGQNDAGMFEFNFRDERYLPFEGAGAISDWQIELSTEKDLRQFDYSTISDVILHLRYTARESGGQFKEDAIAHIKEYIMNTDELKDQPLMRMFSMKHEFPTEWHKFLHPPVAESEQILNFTIGSERMPFFTQHRKIDVMRIDVLARTTKSGDYSLKLSSGVTDADDTVMESSDIPMPQNPLFGNLQRALLAGNVSNINVEDISIEKPMSLRLKHSDSEDFKSLETDPADEVKDILLVLHYKLSDKD